MIDEIRAPKTGLTAEKITITKWYKKTGDSLKKDELLLTIETEKTTLDIFAPRSGCLVEIIAHKGDIVSVSDVIGLVADSANETIGAAEQKRIPVSPIARTLAAEHGIDLSSIEGSGPGGRIQKADIIKQIDEAKDQLKAPGKSEEPTAVRSVKERMKISPVRKLIAQTTLDSKRTIPHYYLFCSVDVTDMYEKRNNFERLHGQKISVDTIMIKAIAAAVTEHPLMNASLEGDEIIIYNDVRIGFVTDTDEGIFIPHITDPQRKSIREVETTVQRLKDRTKNGKLLPEELVAGSISVSNLGIYCVDEFIPVVYPGEIGMLGIGRATKAPCWMKESFVPRDVMKVVLSLDHRMLDGRYGAQFLETLKSILEGNYLNHIFK